MSRTWRAEDEPDAVALGLGGVVRCAVKIVPLVAVVFGGLAVHTLLRVLEAPIFGTRRPWTPNVTRWVCRWSLRIIGLGMSVEGRPLPGAGAMVANHGSWLDIFVLNAATPLYFVSKSEVANWPGIGWLARATGTMFIARETKSARVQTDLMSDRLAAGQKLCFFPEGTSTDSRRVLQFNSTLFQAFFKQEAAVSIQPVTVVYHPPDGATDPRFYGWWGGMTFGGHLVKVLSAPLQGRVEVILHDPLQSDAFPDRKALARAAGETVAKTHAARLTAI